MNMTEKFDGILGKEIDYGFAIVEVRYNPYTDEWTFTVGKQSFVFKDNGKMVYELLSVMKWIEEKERESRGLER